jgi:hypothetical protein
MCGQDVGTSGVMYLSHLCPALVIYPIYIGVTTNIFLPSLDSLQNVWCTDVLAMKK